jgi:[ribosomal protein S5]-alanine N-acetyltransferase
VEWRLDRACWDRGLATEGARASLGYGFEVLELERIISFTVPENVASRRVTEKCGLVQWGETRWRGLDHVWYAIDRREWEAAEN